jgi:hypothetical protein
MMTALQITPASAEVTPAGSSVAFTQFSDQQTGFCLDSNYSDPGNPQWGAVYTDPCNGGLFQEWAMTAQANGTVLLTDVQTGYCLDSNPSNPSDTVYTDPCVGDASQEWYIGASNPWDFLFQNAQSGSILDSNYAASPGAVVGAVYADGCNGGAYQQWTYPSGGGFAFALPSIPVGYPIPQICT